MEINNMEYRQVTHIVYIYTVKFVCTYQVLIAKYLYKKFKVNTNKYVKVLPISVLVSVRKEKS